MTLPDFLTRAADGEIRLTGHRIGLFHVVYYYRAGYSPEMLVSQYPTIALAQIHKVIAWYLDNQPEVDRYIADCQEKMTEQRSTLAHLETALLRQRMAALRRESESA